MKIIPKYNFPIYGLWISVINLFAKVCFTTIFFYKFANLISGCSVAQIIKNQKIDRSFNPTINDSEREKMYNGWKKAVNRTFNWIEK